MHTGCANLVATGRYCDKHKRIDKNYYGSPEWRAVRQGVLRHNPYCDCGQIATEVHHNSDGSLVSKCKSCHSKITRVQVSR